MMIYLLIPAHNESDYLPQTIEALGQGAEQLLTSNKLDADKPDVAPQVRLLIADDHSTDLPFSQLTERCRTALKASNAKGLHFKLEFYQNSYPKGKGQCLNFLIETIESTHSPKAEDYVIILDADLGKSASQIYKLLEGLDETGCQLCVAAFSKTAPKKGFGRVLKLARTVLKEAETSCGLQPRAWISPLSGQRALRWETLKKLAPLADGFGVELIMTIQALELGLTVCELPLALSHRSTGRDLIGTLHRLHQYYDIKAALNLYQGKHR